MTSFRRIYAACLLAAFLGGGLLGPAAHEWEHAEEATESEALHAAHGCEAGVASADAPVDPDLEPEWACVVCPVLSSLASSPAAQVGTSHDGERLQPRPAAELQGPSALAPRGRAPPRA